MPNNKQKYMLVGDGESVHLLKWVKELQKYFDVIVVSSQGFLPEMRELVNDNKRYSLQVNINKDKLSLSYISKVRSLGRIINQQKPSFVNAHYISSNGFLVALVKFYSRHKFIFIASAWGTDVLVFPWKNKVFFGLMKFVLTQADWVTSDSEYMSSIIKKIRNIEVLTFTFGLNSLPDYDPSKCDENLFFSNRALSPNYNIDRVLNVFSKIYKKNSKSRLVISNQGEEKESLVNQCKELGLEEVVEFIGFAKEKQQADIYSRACGYFSLPDSDSTSVSLLEALSYGCIPILSDIPANREWVVDGENGLIIKDDISLNKLEKLKANREEIAQKNRAIIAERGIFPDLIASFIKTISNQNQDQ